MMTSDSMPVKDAVVYDVNMTSEKGTVKFGELETELTNISRSGEIPTGSPVCLAVWVRVRVRVRTRDRARFQGLGLQVWGCRFRVAGLGFRSG